MSYITKANWLKSARDRGDSALTFTKNFKLEKEVKSAEIEITSLGVYFCVINGKRIAEDVFTPGWTDYFKRIQYQTYDITDYLRENNSIDINVGQGWRYQGWINDIPEEIGENQPGVIAALRINFTDGTESFIFTDDTWHVKENSVRYNHLYNGETVDFNYEEKRSVNAKVFSHSKDILIPDEGEKVLEHEVFTGQKLIITPKGENVIDFGQELTGYVSFKVKGNAGDIIEIQHFEVLDAGGNVYTANLRSAKAKYTVICDGNPHTVKPLYTFYGFRYIAVSGMTEEIHPEDFKAIAVYSDIKPTGTFNCSDEMINQLFHNITWGQRGNFLDVPTDCPQRDERLGWTGDAQVFCKTASYNFDVEKFFGKWLGDVRAEQKDGGLIPHFVPASLGEHGGSAAWSDVATIVPWQMYLTYGNEDMLRKNFDLMKNWVDYIKNTAANKNFSEKDLTKSKNPYLWNNGNHFGDWLALDLPDLEDTRGATEHDFIGQAYFAYSASLLIKAGNALGIDIDEYKELLTRIKEAFREEYVNEDGTLTNNTQTAYVLALYFDLVTDRKTAAKKLTELVKTAGHLTTGFVGTPYLMHVLSDIGETKTAYDLLFRKEFPSWCYSVIKGATTMWERWNGIKPDGSFATPDMNSFNHYAYGAVGDWMYENMAGIKQADGSKGFEHIVFEPETDDRLTFVSASIETRRGLVKSEWEIRDGKTDYTFTVPAGCEAEAKVGGKSYSLNTGINKITI